MIEGNHLQKFLEEEDYNIYSQIKIFFRIYSNLK